jgi:hypothetical protein
MGTAAPTLVLAVAPDGRWAVLCQARVDTDHDGRLEVRIGPHGDPYGDSLTPYLVEGQGPGVEIDHFLGADPTGRFLLLAVHGKPVLRDTTTGHDTELAGARSPMAFGAGGAELVYARVTGSAWTLVVRTLATGAETTLDPGPGELLGMEIYDRARAVRVVMKLRAPGDAAEVHHSDRYRGRCAGPAAASYEWGVVVSAREQRLVSLKDGRVRVVPEAIAPFADGWLRTLADGAVRFETFAGDSVEMVGAGACKVLYTDRVGRVIAACQEAPGWALRRFGAGGPRLLGTFDRDISRSGSPFGRHFLLTERDAGDLIVDVETGARRLSPKFQRVIAIRDDRTLVQRDTELVVLEGDGERVLGPIEPYPRIFGVHDHRTAEAERLVLVGTLIVDMARGEIAGVVPDEPPLVLGGLRWEPFRYKPFGLTRDGWILVESPPQHPARVMSEIALGPMHWARATAPGR